MVPYIYFKNNLKKWKKLTKKLNFKIKYNKLTKKSQKLKSKINHFFKWNIKT